MINYITYLADDPYQLPCAVLPTQKELANWLGCSVSLVELALRTNIFPINGYLFERVRITL